MNKVVFYYKNRLRCQCGTALALGIQLLASAAVAQDAVPTEMLQRTLPIQAADTGGTGFFTDYQGKLYLLTARHVVAGLPLCRPELRLWYADKWNDFKPTRILYPSSALVDIAVLETNEVATKVFGIPPMGDEAGLTFGQKVWFLGYPLWSKDFPHGMASSFSQGTRILPFIKSGTMSAIDSSNPDAVVLYVDGFNNPGFSGGPILYWDFRQHAYRIAGVIQGYKSQAAQAIVNGVSRDTNVLVNSGILVGYSIKHAFQAIKDAKHGVRCADE
jgi:S1-C subfamily serine protease